MNTTKHTPGPWSVGGTRSTRAHGGMSYETLIHVGEGGNAGNALATVHLGGPGAIHAGNREEIEANAALIAAAPELLEALGELLEYHLMLGNSAESSRVDMARAAIAKAEGRS